MRRYFPLVLLLVPLALAAEDRRADNPFLNVLWLVHAYGPPEAAFPAHDVHTKAGIVAALRKGESLTRQTTEGLLAPDMFARLAGDDGELDPEEVREANLRRIQMDQSTAIPLIDWNGDGYVDFTEFSSGMRSVFEEYDANGDGVVTLGEMHLRIPRTTTDAPPGSAPGGPH